jgi:hypothetical protein
MKTADLMGCLADLRVSCPELRFGQLIATIGMLAEDETGHSLWDVEDPDFVAALERFAADMARRHSESGVPGAAHGDGGVKLSRESATPSPPRRVG